MHEPIRAATQMNNYRPTIDMTRHRPTRLLLSHTQADTSQPRSWN